VLRFLSYTAVTGLGRGVEALADALAQRRSALEPCRFETAQLDTMVAEVAGLDDAPLRSDLAAYECRNNRLAQLALEQDGFADAVRAARDRHGAARIGVFLGTSTSGILETEIAYRHRDPATGALPAALDYRRSHNSFSVVEFVRAYFDLAGPAVAVCTACSSGAKVFGNARRMIELGLIDAAVVGGVDSLCLTTLYGFHSLEVLSATACRPFDPERNGISIGEGAAFVLLGRGDAGVALLGVGESSDAYHMSAPHPQGLGAQMAMRAALDDAGLAPDAIDYINLHGTATPANDTAESLAVSTVFGRPVACSSTKGATGHALGAAGAIEAVIAAIALERGLIPGSAGTQTVDTQLLPGYRLQPEAAALRHVLSNSFGFGGSNCALVLGLPS
jgi:3-oxoacyl-[acyl-carrier-protein] synthase-1